ncbi:MAG TPA: SurA N-terminal domain-containing protein, partial [Candidatus Eisenbacteria bacterium]
MKRWILFGAVLCALHSPAARVPGAQASERIAAIVNKQVILSSDVDDRTLEAAARMHVDPGDSVALGKLRAEVLNQMVEKEVLMAEVTRQAITVSNADVAQAVDREIDNLKQRLGSEEEYRAALAREKTTEADLRKRYEPDVRDQLL